MDQVVHPCIELGERNSLGAAYKGLIIGMQQGIPVHDVGKRAPGIPAQLF